MFFLIKEYIKYLLKAESAFKIHAPFAYDFYTRVILTDNNFPESLNSIEEIRNTLLRSLEKIKVTDFGTGLLKNNELRKVSNIATSHLNNKKDAFLMFRIVNVLKPKTILELGTSLGITTLYLSKAAPDAQLYTIEGSPETAQIAQRNFENFDIDINLIVGNIDDVLPMLLINNVIPDFVYFDGNHTYEATMRYFKLCLQYSSERTVYVFDDIYWSSGMKQAWRNIISYPEVTLSIDLFSKGIVFFRKNSAKQHFVLKY